MFEPVVFAIVLSLLAHGAHSRRWCNVVLRVLYGLVIFLYFTLPLTLRDPMMHTTALLGVSSLTLIQFKAVRLLLVPVFTAVNQIAMGRPVLAALGKLRDADGQLVSFIPHLNGLFCYIALLTLCLGSIDPSGFTTPFLKVMPSVRPVSADVYETLCNIALCFFGVGLFITRSFPQVWRRLGLQMPTLKQIAIAVTAMVCTFAYDFFASLFTHNASAQAPSVMSRFNEGAYLADGSAPTAFVQALTTGITAGLEEEIMFRGAVQPVLGILPAAFLHAAMHQQFAGAPWWILQIFIWSAAMGVLRRYTNTTTTIIAHGSFNFVQVFMIGFNPR